MVRYCDLHTHSCFSDGTCTPVEIIEKAVAMNLSAVALTDHNTVAGLPEFLAAARGNPIEAIPGVEISTNYGETELHIVGLFLPEASFAPLTAVLEAFNRKKEESNRVLVQNLTEAGFPLDYDVICRNHPVGTVNRAVIAAALVRQGYVNSVKEAFQSLLSKKGGYYIPPERLESLDAIRLLRKLDAVPVLAHPLLNLKTEEALRRFLAEAVPAGLVGMETMYASYTPEETALARCLAAEYGLKESGGSDFHGEVKPHIQLGTGKGNLAVPADFVRNLKMQGGAYIRRAVSIPEL